MYTDLYLRFARVRLARPHRIAQVGVFLYFLSMDAFYIYEETFLTKCELYDYKYTFTLSCSFCFNRAAPGKIIATL